MNTDELRIGNLIKHNGKYIIVKSIFKKGINATFDKETFQLKEYIKSDEIEPVYLDSKILYKLGLKERYTRYPIPNVKDLFIDRKVDKYYLNIDRLQICVIQTVHQLQNLLKDGYNVNLSLKRFL